MILYVKPEGRVFESYTFEDGMKRFKVFSEDLADVFRFAEDQRMKIVCAVD